MADSTLSQHAEIVMGQSPPGEACNTDGLGLPLLNGPTEYGPHHPTPVQFTTDSRKLAHQNDILFCVRGSTTGRMNWADREYAIGRGVAAIRHNENLALQPFVRAVIEYSLPGLLAQATGSTFPNVSAGQLVGLWWPPLEEAEQQVIALILGNLDDRIELNRRMNETLESIARTIFKSWFVDFDPVHARMEGRQPVGMDAETAKLFSDSFVESSIGKVPVGWGVGVVADSADIQKDSLDPSEFPSEAFHLYSIPAYDSGLMPDLVDGGQIKSNKFVVPEGAMLVSKLNPRIPRVWLPIDNPSKRQICSTEFMVMTPKDGFTAEYLFSFFSSENFFNTFVTLVTGTSGSHQRVKPDYLKSMASLLPSRDVVESYSELVRPLLTKILRNKQQSEAITDIRDALLPKLISGEIRVKDAEKFVEELDEHS
jgi:type I restriction enzyme S subunit